MVEVNILRMKISIRKVLKHVVGCCVVLYDNMVLQSLPFAWSKPCIQPVMLPAGVSALSTWVYEFNDLFTCLAFEF